MTTHPSQFASSLNQIGVPYKIAYSVSLTLRYIPDLQEEFFHYQDVSGSAWDGIIQESFSHATNQRQSAHYHSLDF